ncbi:MAG: pyruvate, phosphate dikinase [Proteobacteria bacterium]|nr:pyruvate, phosphate dikinase [Cystobacterineae bacterium]MCL2259178.1 pyruvate, phosphate dikinase [Cystobacterineae bacterium]MCL2313793.1 pyruvate, phosphate dikinase [Pseudomonadota bacterium]
MSKDCYYFGAPKADGDSSMNSLLGGKGANLAEMTNLGIPVPPGFTLTTEVCLRYTQEGKLADDAKAQVEQALARMEKEVGRNFGKPSAPLLVSVRSGARASMPGMMDTILNLGVNEEIVQALAKETGNPHFAYDAYRRFIAMYSDVVLGVSKEHFEKELDELRREVAKRKGLALEKLNPEELKQAVPDNALSAEDLKELVKRSLAIVEAQLKKPFPTNPKEQLWGAIGAVFESWNNDRAIAYRRMNQIPDEWGTACNVQAMVFGNLSEDSATGVCFTRDPRTGEREFFGEWLPNAQGEDVVAGTRTPFNVTKKAGGGDALEVKMAACYEELVRIYQLLEKHYRDMLDIEFTIQKGKLYLLQCRVGGRSGRASVRLAVEMVQEGLISKQEAVLRVPPHKLDELLHPAISPDAPKTLLAKGLPAGPGAACGHMAFSADEAARMAGEGKSVILVRRETSPEDIHGMKAASGILTARGGMTSHAAVVARVIGKCCIVGCSAMDVDYAKKTATISIYAKDGHIEKTVVLKEGDEVTLSVDDKGGALYLGKVPMTNALTGEHFEQLMKWADAFRRMRIRTNADKASEAKIAMDFGAEGIGLCRTEHMFFEEDRVPLMREMIVADTQAEREVALAKLLPLQRADFVALFKQMAGMPVTIRLLDPPLHEFLPTDEAQFAALAKATGLTVGDLKRRADERHEQNPMLGHRGVRLAITYPEIYAMQIRAILEAACLVQKEGKEKVVPEIMIPLAATVQELEICKKMVEEVAAQVFAEQGLKLPYLYGTMIELPRAALCAGSLAKEAEFFSFGTNDLTQTGWGLSRDDAGRFLPAYEASGIVKKDPFQTLDTEGIGALVEMASQRGRKARPGMKLGVCGEHGGDPASIFFFDSVGLDYVSCSPFRVPIARLASAQATLKSTGKQRVGSSEV